MNIDFDFQGNWLNGTFEYLVVFFVASLFVLGIAWLVCILAKSHSAAKRFGIWQTAFLSLCLLPLLVIMLPPIPLGWFSNHENSNDRVPVDSSVNSLAFRSNKTPVLADERRETKQPIGDFKPTNQKSLTTPTDQKPESDEALKLSPPIFDKNERAKQPAILKDNNPKSQFMWTPLAWKAIPVVVWVLGAVFFLLRIVYSLVIAQRLSRTLVPIKQTEVETTIPVLRSKQATVPLTVGVLSPRIILPNESIQWSSRKRALVLKHELAHVMRSDVLWQLLVATIRSLFWFQPLAWIGESKMKLEREKACDDCVLADGAKPSDYASVLLAVATEFSGRRHLNLVNGLSMAKKPVESRLATILDDDTCRAKSTFLYRLGLVFAFALLAVTFATVRPFSPLPASADEPNKTEIVRHGTQDEGDWVELPNELVGTVLDHEGNPVANCEIDVSINTAKTQPKGGKGDFKDYKIMVATSDLNGVFRLNTSGIKAENGRCLIYGFARAQGFPHFQFSHGINNKTGKFVLPEVQLRKGRKITGQLVVPQDTNDMEPLKNPIIQLTGDGVGKFVHYWQSSVIQCDSEGRFTATIPEVGRVEMRATADNYAGKLVLVDARESDLGKIELQKGTSVFGQVIDRTGKPASGVIVSIKNDSSTDISELSNNAIFFELRSSVKTDEQGRFRLPPFHGPCSVQLTKSGRLRGQDHFLRADRDAPVVSPKQVDLTDMPAELEVNFVAEQTVKVSGIVRWASGEPVPKVEVRLGLLAGDSYPWAMDTYTDDKGYYELTVPVDAKRSIVSVFGARDEKGVWNYGYPDNQLGSNNQSSQSQTFDQLKEDVIGADWVLKIDDSRTKIVERARKKTEADLAFAEIEARYIKASDGLLLADATPFVSEFLEFEEKYRGEYAAVVGLEFVLSRGSSVVIGDATARDVAIQRLTDHYTKHDAIDMCVYNLTQNRRRVAEPAGLGLLHLIQKENPDPLVRASAIHAELEWTTELLLSYSYLEQRDWKLPLDVTPDTPQETLQAHREREKEVVGYLQRLDIDELRSRTDHLVELLSSDYGDVKKTGYISSVNSIAKEKYYAKDRVTFRVVADRITFELEKLRIGQPAPEVEGKDVDGNEVRLSSFRGKVVILFFDAIEWGNDRGLKQRLTVLKEQHPENLEVLSIMMDQSKDSIREAIEEGQISWPVIHDGTNGPIATRWRCRSVPSDIFLIDQEGVIKRRLTMDSDLEQIVNAMMQSQD